MSRSSALVEEEDAKQVASSLVMKYGGASNALKAFENKKPPLTNYGKRLMQRVEQILLERAKKDKKVEIDE